MFEYLFEFLCIQFYQYLPAYYVQSINDDTYTYKYMSFLFREKYIAKWMFQCPTHVSLHR